VIDDVGSTIVNWLASKSRKEHLTMRIVIDAELCEGHGRCEETAPRLFDVRDHGDRDLSVVLVENPGEEFREAAEMAARLCPRQAISIRDD